MDIKLKLTYFSVHDGLEAVTINGKRLNWRTSELVSVNPLMIREVYKSQTGFYWLHVTVPGVGHYVGLLTEQEAECIIIMNDADQKQHEEANHD